MGLTTLTETADPRLQRAMQALRENRPQAAEAPLRKLIEDEPGNANALALLAEAVLRQDRHAEAEELLLGAIVADPDLHAARHALVTVLLMRRKNADAFAHIDAVIAREPRNAAHRALKAMAHAWVGQHAQAAKEYELVLAAGPTQPGPWLAHAHTLRTLGRGDDAVAAYRKAIERFPKLGEPYWSLANVKTFRFDESEVAAMRALLATSDLPVESKIQIGFALGHALEERGDHEASFERYRDANALKRVTLDYNAERTSAYVTNCRSLFTPAFLAQKSGGGATARDPIFIVGLPRSGSTLIEQILASHPMVEGTMELRVLPYIVGRVGSKGATRFVHGQTHRALLTDSQAPYPEILRNLDQETFAVLGGEYLERASVHRLTERPLFTDKMPDNFAHVGFIHFALPNAKIVDARRHPLACCMSAFKHYFPLGKDFSYSLSDLGRYYSDYVSLMAHFDEVLPGKVHRVFYERMIETPEAEIRRLLDYLELPFEEACLRFHETERPVRTASAEQVRRPISQDARENWRPFEPWLGPLKAALGPALDAYPHP
jgi:tetratricopeptide (TPR) repeat protein